MAKRITRPALDQSGVWQILTDQPLPPTANRFMRFSDAKLLRELYADHGAEVLDYWTARYPGTRPASWWRAHPEYRRERIHAKARESQASFLKRNNLFVAGEFERLPAGALKKGRLNGRNVFDSF